MCPHGRGGGGGRMGEGEEGEKRFYPSLSLRREIDFAYIIHDPRHDIEGSDDSGTSIVALLAFGRTFTTVQRDNEPSARAATHAIARARTYLRMYSVTYRI